jgi:pSer/pThr/pTyr-binding forkhead associated (FHA) protein
VKKYFITICLAPGQISTALELTNSIYLIGRNSNCAITVIDPRVSRVHCCLILMPPDFFSPYPYYVLKDGGLNGDKSANGTWVNGQNIINKIFPLNNHDELTFGQGLYYPKVFFSIETEAEEIIENPTMPSDYEE